MNLRIKNQQIEKLCFENKDIKNGANLSAKSSTKLTKLKKINSKTCLMGLFQAPLMNQ